MTPAGKPVTSVVGIDPRVDLDGSTEGNGCIARHIFLYVPVEFEPFCILGEPVGKPLSSSRYSCGSGLITSLEYLALSRYATTFRASSR